MNVAQCFGENLARLRRQAGQSQDELADRSTLHRTVISQLETGKREARASTILKLAGGLEVEPGELFEGIEFEPPRPAKAAKGRFKTRSRKR
jgi:transcriptional regulator with XRE-family HTH domain